MGRRYRWKMTPLDEMLWEAGYTGRWLARQLGVHETQVARWRRGAVVPRVSTQHQIAALLGVTTDSLWPSLGTLPIRRSLPSLLPVQHPLYDTWVSMIQRCTNPKHQSWQNYGGRGITVCDRWREDGRGFANFIADMGERPEWTTLDRIDNDGPYSPENCRWATGTEQAKNRRRPA